MAYLLAHNQAASGSIPLLGSMDTTKLFPVGTKARIGQDLEATILGICIYAHDIEYQCAWWNGRERKCEWLNAAEISATEQYAPVLIGFVNHNSPLTK